ncbi:MAG: hypothetical protein E4G95_05745 [Bacteroidia bacterium]|nr:MAG: hypothetical protein E4G95_05745 [Bacteroidia bacterium]
MKKLSLLIIMVLFMPVLISSNPVKDEANTPVGKWKFSIPDAPYEYNNGYIEFKKEEEGYTGIMKFGESEYGFTCDGVQFKDEVISFGLFVDGMDVFITLNFPEPDKLSGTVLHPDGEVYISATRVVEEKK